MLSMGQRKRHCRQGFSSAGRHGQRIESRFERGGIETLLKDAIAKLIEFAILRFALFLRNDAKQ
jgi:hypothetical protein